MRYLIGNAPESQHYRTVTFAHFLQWENMQQGYQLDIETNVTPWWCTKELKVIQFGSIDGSVQYIIQYSSLSVEAREKLKQVLENHSKIKVVHNGMFECVVLRFHGIRVTNLYDTMLAEMVLYCGMVFREETDEDSDEESSGFYALTSLTDRYLSRRLDKSEQLSFGDDELTESKVLYAAEDVTHLGSIMQMQKLKLHQFDLEFVASLENDVLPAYAEMTYYGMEIDRKKWMQNVDLAMPLVQQAKDKLDEWIKQEPFLTKAVQMGLYSHEDKFVINWNSPLKKKQIIDKYFPFLTGKSSKAVLTKICNDYDKKGVCPFSDERAIEWARAFMDMDTEKIQNAMLEIDKQWLVDQELLTPGGTPTINWNSRDQVLPLFRLINPKMESLDAEAMSKFVHPIGRALEDYKDNLKLLTTYGEAFLVGSKKKLPSVEPDGKVRTTFNQIVSTGRISSRRPNMQNIPAKESVGTRYRNAFVCEPDWDYVDSDFSSQELVIIAYLSQDPVWNAALKNGEDLHSVCAELVFPANGWKNAAQPECAYYQLKDGKNAHQKCKCKAHKRMRDAVKSINFGLAYGMSKYKLASTLQINVKEADKLIQDYFKAFPKIGALLTSLGRFGVTRGYIQTISPFFRKRWFPYWKYAQRNIQNHIREVQYDATLGSIERASKNMPIQGTAGDMAKLSLLMLYNFIHENGLSDKVRLVMQVHDQNTTQAHKSISEYWSNEMDRIMRDAAKFLIPNGLLKAETTISPHWTK